MQNTGNDSLLTPFLEGFKRSIRLSIVLPVAVIMAVIATVITLCFADDRPDEPSAEEWRRGPGHR